MADIDISRFLHPLDIISPVEAALRLHESRENEKTQRMFAQSQMARQSAQDFREEREHTEKEADKERQRQIDQATALGTIQQMMRQPGGTGPAQALGEAYGIHVNPLTATTPAANEPPQGDAVDQLLASPVGVAAAAPAVGAGPVEGPAPPPGITSGGMAPVVAASREGAPGETLEGPQQLQDAGPGGRFLLPTAFHVSPGMQDAMNHTGAVPRGSAELPPGGPPAASPAAGDLESLMSRAAPQPTPPPVAPPMNPLYEAVMGGKHYPISAEQPQSGLSPKFDAVFRADLAMGAPAQAAFGKAYAAQQAEEKEAATEHRMLAVLGGRNDQQNARDDKFKLTADQQLQREKDREANGRTIARIRAAAAGASTPQQQTALAQMIAMKEQGAQDSEIAAFGAQNHVDPKVWNAPVKNVQTEAAGSSRATERRAGMEFHSADGALSGTAASPQEATKLRDKDSKFEVVRQRAQDLINDVKEHGNRVDVLSPDQIQNRMSMGAALNAALRPYNGLGGTDASQKLESEITGALGTPGHGFLFGANPTILNRILREAEEKHARDIKIGLRPGGGAPLPAALTHDRPPAAGGAPDLDALEKWSAGLGAK